MTGPFTGNMQNEIAGSEHDSILKAKKTSLVSAATIYAVTGASISGADGAIEDGVDSGLKASVFSTASGYPLMVYPLSGPTVFAVVNTAAAGQSSVVLDTSSKWIGLATTTIGTGNATLFAVVNTAAAGQSSVVLDTGDKWVGLATVNVGNELNSLTTTTLGSSLPAGTNNIGDVDVLTMPEINSLATVTQGSSLPAGTNYIGLASVNVGNTITADVTGQGDVPVTLDSEQVDISDRAARDLGTVDVANTVTVDLGANNDVGINAGTNYIGLASINVGGSLPSINGEVEQTTSKTLQYQPIVGNTSGPATIFVPTNTFKITNLLLSFNATVGVNIKSGPTYLTGNASISMTFNPAGGVVENGSLLNPVYDGLADGGALVIETDDVVDYSGKVTYYEE